MVFKKVTLAPRFLLMPSRKIPMFETRQVRVIALVHFNPLCACIMHLGDVFFKFTFNRCRHPRVNSSGSPFVSLSLV